MVDYYQKIYRLIKEQKFEETAELEGSEDRLHSGEVRYTRSTSYNWLILVWALAAVLIGGLLLVQVMVVVPSATTMVEAINALMKSENVHLEVYYEMKTYYLAFDFNKTQTQITQELEAHLNHTEVVFIRKSKAAIDLFDESDPPFKKDFNDLIIKDVCELTANSLEPWQVEKCTNGMHFHVLKQGVAAGMTSL